MQKKVKGKQTNDQNKEKQINYQNPEELQQCDNNDSDQTSSSRCTTKKANSIIICLKIFNSKMFTIFRGM